MKRPYYFGRDHSVTCWIAHEECALRAATSYLSARIEHDRARLARIRLAGQPRADFDQRCDGIDLAREILTATHQTDWSGEETA